MNKMISLAALILLMGAAGTSMAAGNVAAGKARSATCAACHGVDGNSAAPNFPKLAGLDAGYIVKQLSDFKSGARKDPIMSGMAAPLSTKDMADLAAYFASQKRSPGVANLTDETRKAPETLYRGGNTKLHIPACMSCHGPAGVGIGPNYPSVGGQHATYTAKQLADFKSGARSNDNNIMRQIAFLLTDSEIKELSEYMAGLH